MTHKRKSCSIQEKYSIVLAIEGGESKTSVAQKYNRQRSTVSTIWQKKEQIKLLHQQGLSNQKKIKRHKFQEIDQPLLQFIRQTTEKHTGEALAVQAQQYAENFGYAKNEIEKIDTNWVNRFKTRYGLITRKNRESSSAVENNILHNPIDLQQFENINSRQQQQQQQQQQKQLQNGNLAELQQQQEQQQQFLNSAFTDQQQLGMDDLVQQQQQNKVKPENPTIPQFQFQQQQQQSQNDNINNNNINNNSRKGVPTATFTEAFHCIEKLERFFKNQNGIDGKILGDLEKMKKIVYQNQLESIIQ